MTTRMRGAVALITGGASGIGAATARTFVAEGARVVVADRDEAGGRALVDELGSSAAFVRLDVTDERGWTEAVAAAESVFGPVTVLVNSAGICPQHTTVDADLAAYRQTLDVNLMGPVLGMRAVHAAMRAAGGGAIVNIASISSIRAMPGIASYVASKWALLGATKAAALELASDGIRVNAVLPGHIHTPMNPVDMDGIPLGRKGTPEDIAQAVLHLSSDDARYTTGAELVVGGGISLGF